VGKDERKDVRKSPTKRIEQYRVTDGPFGSDASFGANGHFLIPFGMSRLSVIASDGTDWGDLPLPIWEHVSVSLPVRCPTWTEMDFVKNLFWRDDETVMQFHVPKSEHVNCHQYCLHLWKPIGIEILRPPASCVGPATRKQ
jgi:hypothetical protein